jgi:hypothetical protein
MAEGVMERDGRAALQELEAYWRALRGARRIPVRTDVDPARIDAILPRAFILEHVAPGIARVRVAGQGLNAMLGLEARGMPLSALFGVESRPGLQGWLGRVFEAPAVVELGLMQPGGFLRAGRRGRMLILPLLGPEGAVTRAIGAVDVQDGWAPGPFRLDAAEDARCEPVGEIGAVPLRVVAGGDGVAARAARGGLRLVVSNG